MIGSKAATAMIDWPEALGSDWLCGDVGNDLLAGNGGDDVSMAEAARIATAFSAVWDATS